MVSIYTSVRLVNDAASEHYHSPTKGRVELHNATYWGTVCDDSFDIQDAEVVCHMLGFPSAIAAHCCAAFGSGSDEILLDDLDCVGNETSLLQCEASEFGEHNCWHFEDAGVTCADTGKAKKKKKTKKQNKTKNIKKKPNRQKNKTKQNKKKNRFIAKIFGKKG